MLETSLSQHPCTIWTEVYSLLPFAVFSETLWLDLGVLAVCFKDLSTDLWRGEREGAFDVKKFKKNKIKKDSDAAALWPTTAPKVLRPPSPRRRPPFSHRRRRRNFRERTEKIREKRENGMVGMKENGSYTLFIPTHVQLGRPSYHPNPLGLANRSSKARLAFPLLSLFCLLFNTPYLLPAPPLLYFIFLMFLCTSSVIFLPLALHFVNSHAF